MRIAIVTKSFAQSNNDWAMPPLIDFVRAMSDEVEVDVYTLYYPFETRSYRLFGAQVHSFDLGRRPRALRPLSQKRIRQKIAEEHTARPYDLIHAIWADAPAVLATKVSSELNIPMITTFYAGEAAQVPEIGYGSLRSQKDRTILQKVLSQSDEISCGSKALADVIFKATQKMPTVIPFGLDNQRFTPDGGKLSLEGEIKIITAASFSAVKGLDILMNTFHHLLKNHPTLTEALHWHIIGPDAGRPDVRDALRGQIANLPITIHEGLPHWEMADFYRAGDLALNGSWFESQCFAAMEPAACGVPVLGTAVGIIPEMVSDEWIGEAGNPEALSEVMRHVLSNRALWASEAERQRKWVHDNATIEVATERFCDLYGQVVERHAR